MAEQDCRAPPILLRQGYAVIPRKALWQESQSPGGADPPKWRSRAVLHLKRSPLQPSDVCQVALPLRHPRRADRRLLLGYQELISEEERRFRPHQNVAAPPAVTACPLRFQAM